MPPTLATNPDPKPAPPQITEQEVLSALESWMSAVNAHDSGRVQNLYAPDAVLLPTLAGGLRDTSATRKQYFDAFTARPNLTGRYMSPPKIKLEGTVAVVGGFYDFAFTHDGKTEHLPARFSFVLEETPKGPLIVHHHSSRVPAP